MAKTSTELILPTRAPRVMSYHLITNINTMHNWLKHGSQLGSARKIHIFHTFLVNRCRKMLNKNKTSINNILFQSFRFFGNSQFSILIVLVIQLKRTMHLIRIFFFYLSWRPYDENDYNKKNKETSQAVINLFTILVLKREKQKTGYYHSNISFTTLIQKLINAES